jgi:integrase
MSSKNEDSLFSSYLDSIGLISNSASTVKAYKYGLNDFGKFTGEKYRCTVHELIVRVKNGDPDVYKMLNEFVVYLHKLGKKPATIRLKIAGVKGFLRYEGIKTYSEDFKQSVKLPKKLRHREEPLTKEILVRLLRVVPIKIQTAILVAIASGMRIGELVQLKISDIDFDSRPTKIRIRAETTKTKEARETFLTNEATKALKDYLTNFFGWHEGNSNPLIQDRIIFGRTSQMKKDDDQMKFKSVTIAENVLAHSMLWHVRKIPELNKLNENGRKMIHFHGFRKYFRTVAGDATNRDFVEALMGHHFYLDTYYLQSEEKRKELYLKAEPYLTISDFVQIEKDLVKMTEKQKQIEENHLFLKRFIDKHFVDAPSTKKDEILQENQEKPKYKVTCLKCKKFLGIANIISEIKLMQQKHELNCIIVESTMV